MSEKPKEQANLRRYKKNIGTEENIEELANFLEHMLCLQREGYIRNLRMVVEYDANVTPGQKPKSNRHWRRIRNKKNIVACNMAYTIHVLKYMLNMQVSGKIRNLRTTLECHNETS